MATKEPVHSSFEGLKARQIPKAVKQVELPEITWADGAVLNESELKHLVTVLREEGPDVSSEVAPGIIAHLNQESAVAWSHRVLKGWEEIGNPAGQKWMLFQYRVFANDEAIEALCDAYDWTELASTGKWARANWYLSLIAGRPATTRSTRLFFDLLSAGKLDGTVQKSARKFLESFASQAGMATQDFLEDAHLIGVFPTGKLPFTVGEQRISGADGEYIVGVHSGELSFTHVDSHRRSTQVPEGLSAQDTLSVTAWQQVVHEEVLRWGGYLHYSMTLGRRFALSTIQGEWFKNPVAQGVLSVLLWRTESGQIIRLEPDEVFDVNYDPVGLDANAQLELVQLTDLDEATSKAWYEHLSDNEMLLPFDILQRDVYIERLNTLLAATFIEVKEHEDAIDSLYVYDYVSGLTDSCGGVNDSYKTFPEFNARVFFEHTGFDVVEGSRFEYPSNVIGVHFQDLFGEQKTIEEVYISVLAEAAVDLFKIKNL